MANQVNLLILLYSTAVYYSVKGQGCDERNLALLEEGRRCRKACDSDANCSGSLKRCLCDNICGWSCFNPNAYCIDPETIANGYIEGENRTYNNVITYHCNGSYTLVGSATRRCRSDRKWTGSVPTCAGGCRSQGFMNAFPTSEQTEFRIGEQMPLGCRTGYRATAREVFAICLSGGTWSTSEIQCREVSCRHPGTPQNGMLIGDRFIFGSRVVIACNRGFQLRDSYNQDFISCTASGEWVGAIPIQEVPTACTRIQCPQPASPAHGSVDTQGQNLEFETQVRYICDFGYQIRGNPVGTCNENSTWGELPVCVVFNDCNFENSLQPTCFYNNNGWQRRFINDARRNIFGYVLRSSQNGVNKLTSQIIQSPVICVTFYYRLQAQLNATSFSVVNVLSDGQRLWSIQEEVENQWQGIQIEIASTDENIRFEFVATSPTPSLVEIDDVKVNYSACDKQCDSNPCSNGATCVNLLGDYRCICTFNHTGRNCEKEITCEVRDAPVHGYTSFTALKISVGQTVRYHCDDGYVLRGDPVLTCKADGSLRGQFPICGETFCPDGYIYHFPYCFRISAITDRQTHQNAATMCLNEGAILATAAIIGGSLSDPMTTLITNILLINGGRGFYWTTASSCVVRGVLVANGFGEVINSWQAVACSAQYRYMCMKWSSQVTALQLTASPAGANGNYYPTYGHVFNGRPFYLKSETGTSLSYYTFDLSAYWEVNLGNGFISRAFTTASTPEEISVPWSNNLQSVSITRIQKWTDWTTWSPCSTTCDRGVAERTRTCTEPSLLLPNCQGPSRQIMNCLVISCELALQGCESDPCLNGGTCTDLDVGYTCSCPSTATGSQCEHVLRGCESNPCQNMGTCMDVDDQFSCICPSSTTGNQCETKTCTISTSVIQNGVLIEGASDDEVYLEGQSLSVSCEDPEALLLLIGEHRIECENNFWKPDFRQLRCV